MTSLEEGSLSASAVSRCWREGQSMWKTLDGEALLGRVKGLPACAMKVLGSHQSSCDSWSVQRVMSLAELVAAKHWLWRAERRHGWQGAFHLGDAMLVIAWPCFALHACAYCVTVWYGMDGIQRQV